MTSRKADKHLHDAAQSGQDAVREAVAAGVAAASALRGAAGLITRRHQEDPPSPPPAPRRQGFFAGPPAPNARGVRVKQTVDKRGGKTVVKRLLTKRERREAERAVVKRDARKAPGNMVRAAVVGTTAAPLTATGWVVLAALILAWPRERSEHRLEGRLGNRPTGLRDRLRDELSTPGSEISDAAKREPGRGRGAHSPAEIPPRGWRDILKRSWKEFNDDRVTAVAGGVTFFGLLALFPAMAAFVSLYGLFADTKTVSDQLRILAGVIPAEALKFVGEQMVRMATSQGSTLSLTFITTLLVSIWSANAGVKAMFDGLNIAYEEKEKRGLIKLNLVSLAFTLGSILFLVVATGSVVAIPVVLGLIGWKLGTLGPVLDLLRWPVLLIGAAGGLSVLYRYGPSRHRAKWSWITPGSAAAALLWLGASMLFSFYVAHFGSYNKTYGSLGAVVGFLTWMWISAIIVLFGAELNSEIEHQTAMDSTAGPEKRLGARGATMADEVAPATK